MQSGVCAYPDILSLSEVGFVLADPGDICPSASIALLSTLTSHLTNLAEICV